MERLAVVVEGKEEKEKATVQFRRHSMCGKCGVCSGPNEEKLEVRNPVGASEGDWVLVTTGEKNILVMALLLYGVPLLTLVGGFILGYRGLESEIMGGILGLGLTALYFFGVYIKDKKLQGREELEPRIKRLAIEKEIKEWQGSS